MEDARDSTTMPQIVEIVKVVVKFHPLLTVTSLIYRVILLQYWIKEEINNQWKALKVYCQSTMRALLYLITEKMKNLSGALQMHLNNEAAKGQLKAKLIGKIALFSATFLMLDIEFSSKYDKKGTKTKLLLFIGLDLLISSKVWCQLEILRARCSYMANSTSNFSFFIMAIVFENFYDNSLRSLSVVFSIAIFLLCLLVVLQPRTDFGLFSFIIGVIGSITYNCFKFMSPTWIIAFICFVLFSFKSWLDKYWLDLEQDESLASTNTQARSTSVILSSGIRIATAIFATSAVKAPLSNYKFWLARSIGSVVWSLRLYKIYPKDTSLPSENTKGVSSSILTIANVAQGMFSFALNTFPVADYKDWLFIVIIYMVFCFWLISFVPKDLLVPSTTTKGIKGMILSFQSVVTYGIVVLVGLEPRLYYREWLATIICYILWWVRLCESFPRDLVMSTIEFNTLQWWMVFLYSTMSDVISWIHLSTTSH